MLALLLVAVSLGLSNCAAAIGIGVSGADARTRLRVDLVFGLFEAAMPLLGLLLGHGLAHTLGHAARWTGAALLIATGLYGLMQALRRDGAETPDAAAQGLGKLLISGLALSIDNLAVGFALGAYHVALLTAAVLIGAVSVTMALIGLELGRLLGTRTGQRGEALGGRQYHAPVLSPQRAIRPRMTAQARRPALGDPTWCPTPQAATGLCCWRPGSANRGCRQAAGSRVPIWPPATTACTGGG